MTRASRVNRNPKSHKGCSQCKVKKVKCDERKPCQNCAKDGIECEGPVTQLKWSRKHEVLCRPPDATRPKNAGSRKPRQPPPPERSQPTPERSPGELSQPMDMYDVSNDQQPLENEPSDKEDSLWSAQMPTDAEMLNLLNMGPYGFNSMSFTDMLGGNLTAAGIPIDGQPFPAVKT